MISNRMTRIPTAWELFIISAVNHTRYIAFLQFGNIIIQCSFRIAGIIYMNVLTLACLGKFLTHLLIQGGHYGVARIVLQIRAVAHRDWCSLGVSNARNKDINAFLVSSGSSLRCTGVMVFAISNHDDGSSTLSCWVKLLEAKSMASADIGSLGLDKTRGNVLEKHLGRNIIGGNWQLYERIASKDDESNLVVV